MRIGHHSAASTQVRKTCRVRPKFRLRRRSSVHSERGFVMMAVLGMIAVLALFGALVMFTAGKEIAMSGMRSMGAQSLFIAEGGAISTRAALMAFLGIYPVGSSQVLTTLDFNTARGWYANGANSSQDPFAILNYLQVDGQQLSFTTPASSETLQVNWGLSTPHLKLQTSGSPSNALGTGTYTASVTLTPNPTPHTSCSGGPCTIHQLSPNFYEIFYNYTAISTGTVNSTRRQVTLSGSFSLQLRLQNFAIYALFTDTHSMPDGTPVWFTNTTTFNGPVHTNDEFRFALFPTFTSKLESVNNSAVFYNNGSAVELAANENVSNGTRIDAPLVPPASSPQAAAPAAFSRGVPSIPLPTGPYSQQGVAIGLDPSNTSPVTSDQIAAAVPELNGADVIPNGIYVPVSGSCQSAPNANMTGGIYVQGDIDSLTMSLGSGGGGTNNLAVYTFVQGSTTTTVTVDRTNNQTTVTSNNWPLPSVYPPCTAGIPGPATRTFNGVPKGYQGVGNTNSAIIYINGSINSLSGTLQQNEQTTIAASGDIVIQDNVLYQNPPDPSNPNSNPTNLLGLYSSGGNIVIGASAPNNVTVHAVMMAGSTNSSASQVYVANYNTGSPRGQATVLGGLIEQYYGPFGTFSGQGVQQTGYGRNFNYDTRMSRGFSPPYFPTTNQFVVNEGSATMTGVRPTWRETAP